MSDVGGFGGGDRHELIARGGFGRFDAVLLAIAFAPRFYDLPDAGFGYVGHGRLCYEGGRCIFSFLILGRCDGF